uniref:Transportin-3 n=1 Tax=Cacopsylla melanoneura TaxID=428564 RepID=A0A8D8ZEZ3_9HEMI
MESQPSLETVYSAVHTLYQNPDKSEKEKASQWLQQLQKSIFAWKIADEMLLHQNELGLEAVYFSAQTMKQKVQNAFFELPSESHASLRDSLIEHLSRTNESSGRTVMTQLALALADLALQMSAWEKPIVHIIEQLSHKGSILALLEVLTVLPEEVNVLKLGKNRRQEFEEELKSASAIVLEFLKTCQANSGDNVTLQTRVLKCYTSWLNANAISLSDITNDVVIVSAFQVLSNHQSSGTLHDAATDCISALLPIIEFNNNFDAVNLNVFTCILSLEEQFHLSVAHEEQEKCMNYCKLFTELAESLLDRIVRESILDQLSFSIKALDLVLICVGHHDYEVASITFRLWYRLSEILYAKNDESLTLKFKPHVERLIGALCKHCQIEPDLEGLLEEDHDFYDFRLKVSELVKDVVFIVGSSTCFRHMFNSLQENNVMWEQTEAALYIMQSVAKNVLPEENDVVPKVVEAILHLPPNTHIAVRYTSLLLLGELCEWIDKHPHTLETILNFLLHCLQQPGLASVTANALQSISTACCTHMVAHFNGLLQIIRCLDTLTITNDAAIGLLKGVAIIVSDMPPDQISGALKELCLVQVKPLCELIEKQTKPEKNKKSDPVLWLDRLAAIFKHTSPRTMSEPPPCQGVITELWPVLSRTCDTYQEDARIMEHACRCLRYAIRCVGKDFTHLLEPLVKQMVVLYSKHPHSSFLYLGSILVDEYATTHCVAGLLDMVQAFLPPTYNLLQQEDGLKNHPDTVDDLFRLSTRFLQRAPMAFLTSNFISSVMQCGILSTHLDHRDANSTVMKFFYDLIHNNRVLSEKDSKKKAMSEEEFEMRHRLMKDIISKHGQVLVSNLLHACVFSLHTYMMGDVADVLYELMAVDRQVSNQWLQDAISQLPKNTPAGMNAATSEQLVAFHTQVTQSESVSQVCQALKELSRLYR